MLLCCTAILVRRYKKDDGDTSNRIPLVLMELINSTKEMIAISGEAPAFWNDEHDKLTSNWFPD